MAQIPDHPYRTLMIRGSGSGETSLLFNPMRKQPDIDKIYFYAKDLYEAKYQLLIKKRESTELKNLKDSKAFIEYSNAMDDIYKNIKEPRKKKRKY